MVWWEIGYACKTRAIREQERRLWPMFVSFLLCVGASKGKIWSAIVIGMGLMFDGYRILPLHRLCAPQVRGLSGEVMTAVILVRVSVPAQSNVPVLTRCLQKIASRHFLPWPLFSGT